VKMLNTSDENIKLTHILFMGYCVEQRVILCA
jgi:hypothetical protein